MQPNRKHPLWPGNRGLAVYIALDLASRSGGDPVDLVRGPQQTDALNQAWREHGMRAGLWRMLKLFRQLELPITVVADATLACAWPSVVSAFTHRGDETVHSGPVTGRCPKAEPGTADPPASDASGGFRGWFAPSIAEGATDHRRIREAGFHYLLDWSRGEAPQWFPGPGSGLPSVPYPAELNDAVQVIARGIEAPAFANMVIDALDEHLQHPVTPLPVLGIALHPAIMGQSHRLPYLRRALSRIDGARDRIWLCHARDIASAFAARTSPDIDPNP